jgi:hypothetical protein
MNYLIALQYKYHSNEKSKNKINRNNNMNIDLSSTLNLLELDKENNKNDNNIISDTTDKNDLNFKTEKKTNIGKYNNNIHNFRGNENSNNNNIKNELVVYPKIIDFNRILDDIKKTNGNSLFYSLRKPNKRKYLDLISENRCIDDKENSNNIINNLVINNNNYFYINNNKYNISSKEKYGFDISKQKILKKY